MDTTDRLPLLALQVFCAVVRQGGFRQAAQALGVTPGAVTRQVQALEAHLGLRLLDRGSGATRPTAAGRRLLARVQGPLDEITAVLQAPQAAGRRSTVRVDCGVTLAMHWLIPQLRDFQQRHPRWPVQVHTVDGDIDPASPADVFIRREVSELRGLPAEHFLVERSLLVAAPAAGPWPGGRAALRRRLQAQPRIGAHSRPDLWPQWCAAQGMDEAALPPTLVFDNTVLAIQAVAQGLGCGVLPGLFIETMLRSGALQPVQAQPVVTGSYSVAVGRQRDSARVRAFVGWLQALGAGA